MHIVKGMEGDFSEIVEVWEDSVRATHDFLSEDDIQFLKPLILHEYLPNLCVYCVQDESRRIAGFVGVADSKVEMLFLAPNHRGKGVGRLLLRFAMDELGAHKVDVNEQNPSALGFYEHMGFRVVDRSPVDAMGKPFPILHMEAS